MTLPEPVANHPLLEEKAWVELRDSGIKPLIESELQTTEESRAEFLVGAWLLGLLDTVHPQMLRVSDMMTAGKLMSAVIMPRRSSKTTTMFCILLGRCFMRPVHMAGFTLLTTQKKTAERYRLDIYGPISRKWPSAGLPSAFEDGAPVRLFKGSGTERIEFSNGSVLAVLSPDGDAIRSGAYDTLLADEAGEATPERWEDFIGAVIPSFDTRPDGQLCLAGTAGDYRDKSEFWNTLNDSTAGRVAYMLPDDVDPEELEAWEPTEDRPRARARELTEQMHPGIGTLTTLDRIENSYNRLGVKKYTREYFNLFGAEGSNTALVPQPLWTAAALPLSEAAPAEVCSIVLQVNRDADYASVVRAWNGADGRVHVALDHWQTGVKDLPTHVMKIIRQSKRALTYDTGGSGAAATLNVVSTLREARPAPTERPLTPRDSRRASVLFMQLLREDRLRHFDQHELNAAVEIAVKRAWTSGTGWGFGTPKERETADITPIEAAALAVYALQDERARAVPVIEFYSA